MFFFNLIKIQKMEYTNCWSPRSIPLHGECFNNIIHAQVLDKENLSTQKTACGIAVKSDWEGGYYFNDINKIGCKRCLKSINKK